ncbi:DUF1465 family protein [Altererythrobacter sp.]|uniref:DUF1465 family protein n=1 Tax=Altererythrobacter sp. TaxID=1872480 RepID=UPI003CFEC649
MARPNNLSQPIIESLYTEALVLADEVRAVFALGLDSSLQGASDALRLALSSEGLKATTRMMHVLAWLLNQRAYFSGDLTENQLRKHSELPKDRESSEEDMALLEDATRELIEDTMRLHRRIARLDSAWRDGFEAQPYVRALHERIGRAMIEREMQRPSSHQGRRLG